MMRSDAYAKNNHGQKLLFCDLKRQDLECLEDFGREVCTETPTNAQETVFESQGPYSSTV